jgi:1,4-dihydroxy-6-naphthoate synthase
MLSTTTPHERLEIGISPCPNDVYIFAGLIRGAVSWDGPPLSFVYEDVETLNAAARQGRFPALKISYAAYIHIADEYELLDCGGALGRGVGPLLLANGGVSFDPEREVLVPGEYTTANFLLDFYLRRPVRKRYLPFDAVYAALCNQTGAQGVVIHEKRFTYADDGLTLVQDLGEHWEDRTGYAIPLGAIVVRRGSGLREPLEAAIRRSLVWADAHPAEALALCREYAQDFTDSVMRAHIGLYVNEYSHDLGTEGRAAVAFFLAEQKRFRNEVGNVSNVGAGF